MNIIQFYRIKLLITLIIFIKVSFLSKAPNDDVKYDVAESSYTAYVEALTIRYADVFDRYEEICF